MHHLSEAIQTTKETLSYNGIPEASLEAKLLVNWITKTNPTDIVIRPNIRLSPQQTAQLKKAIKQRIAGKPLYRIIGTREFYGIPFTLSRDTLEPRSDTETLVDLVLPILQQHAKRLENIIFLDMGTGSGAIAVALLKNVDKTHAVAVDISENALKTAVKNATNAKIAHRFTPLLSNWFNAVSGQFDLIISNPPYIPQKDIKNLAKEVRDHDPLRALIGGKDGLYFYKKLARESINHLKEGGHIAVEVGYSQNEIVCDIFEQNGFKCLETRKDLNNIPRALLFSFNH
ncbi:peptide chain release factor N(5)-glutamine methyltransferase [Bartonella ancashensis]|uniref:Release factor glutamine methyltransferase n=1 Tax=Bartonella ancashensis TaxID=1318743 RepID=A0A0M4LHG9_9HYPH|nr:peptide chain release factor N(5)-glutamine methyltransferase [Bartonella ancashensis]ALE04107.1 Methylase of polypeptide chain release factors [Bartonella ancashensis]